MFHWFLKKVPTVLIKEIRGRNPDLGILKKLDKVMAEKDNFLLTVKENSYVKVKGFSMFILAKRLKNIKKVQQSLDKDPLNALLTEEKMVYSRAYRDAVIDEERLIKVEKLEEENKSLTKELKSFNTKVKSLVFKETIVDKEKSSKQRKKIIEIDADAEVNLENVYSLDMAHEEIVLSMQDVTDANVSTGGGELNAANEEPVSVAPTNITTAQLSEATKTTVNITTAPKAKGIVFHDMEESTTRIAS
nr:hypothetical protein [Tanacetum cinerariifolium]